MAFTLIENENQETLPARKETPAPMSPSPTETQGEEGWGQWALRQGARGLARGTEAALGLPGDIAQGVLALSQALPFETGKGGWGEKILGAIPTSQDINKYLTKPIEQFLPQDYLTAQSEGEKFVDDVVGDLSTLLIPIKGKVPFKSALKAAGAGNIASFLGKQFGAGEKGQAGLKMAGMLMSGLSLPKKDKFGKYVSKGEQVASRLYKDAEKAIPAGARLETKNVYDQVNKLRKIVNMGDATPEKAFMRTRLENLENAMSGNTMPVREAWSFKRDYNTFLRDWDTPKGVKKFLPTLTHELNQSLQSYGKSNPQFLKAFNEADALFGAMNNGIKVRDLFSIPGLKNTFKNLNYGTAALLGGLSYLNPAIGGTIGAGIFAKRALSTLASSPTLQKEYLKMIGDAGKVSMPVMVKNIKSFDKKMTKEMATSEKAASAPPRGFTLLD